MHRFWVCTTPLTSFSAVRSLSRTWCICQQQGGSSGSAPQCDPSSPRGAHSFHHRRVMALGFPDSCSSTRHMSAVINVPRNGTASAAYGWIAAASSMRRYSYRSTSRPSTSRLLLPNCCRWSHDLFCSCGCIATLPSLQECLNTADASDSG